jgi:fucose permease
MPLKNRVLNHLAQRYISLFSYDVVLILLAFLIIISGATELDADAEDESVASANSNKTSIFQFPHLLFGVLALFLYVGVEVIAGDTIINVDLRSAFRFHQPNFWQVVHSVSCLPDM